MSVTSIHKVRCVLEADVEELMSLFQLVMVLELPALLRHLLRGCKVAEPAHAGACATRPA